MDISFFYGNKELFTKLLQYGHLSFDFFD